MMGRIHFMACVMRLPRLQICRKHYCPNAFLFQMTPPLMALAFLVAAKAAHNLMWAHVRLDSLPFIE